MTIKDLKEWINKLPEDAQDFTLVIRDLKLLEDDKLYNRDSVVGYGLLDQKIKQIVLFDIESTKIIQKIKEINESKNKIEGSIPQEDKKD